MAAIVNLYCAVALSAVFAVSAWSKLRTPSARHTFARTTADLGGVASRWVAPVATVVVGAEAATALALLLPWTRPAAFVAAALLLVGFTVVIVRAIRGRRAVACACFGASATPVNASHVVRNGLL